MIQNNAKKDETTHEADNDKEGPGKSRNKEEDMEKFTDDKDSVSWTSAKEDDEEVIPNRNTDEQDTPWLQNKPDKKDKGNLRFVFFCILVILISFPLFGLMIYFVQEGRKVKC